MDAKKALNIVAGQCSKKEYCSADVLAKLRRWELPEKDIVEIMAFLVKNRFLDDARFAEAYARDKFRFNRWGKLKIAQMLRRTQVADSVIGQALAALPEEDTDATCMELLRQKNKSIKDEDPYKRKAKLIRFALSRGFEYETVSRCLSHLAHFL